MDYKDYLYKPDAPKGRKVTIADFELGEELGQGQYGTVHVARDRCSNAIVAVKRMNLDHVVREDIVSQVERELMIMQTLDHPNILTLYSYFWDDANLYLILEYCSQGDLFAMMRKRPDGRFTVKETAKFVCQLTMAIQHCHERFVLHRDIKPENLLIDAQDNLKLADFGWGVLDASQTARTTYCGTPDYIPPEMLAPSEQIKYGPEVDIWCIGVFMYECLYGEAPFAHQEEKERDKKILRLDYHFPSKPQIPLEAKELITSLLRDVPGSRGGTDDILQSVFVKKYFPEAARKPVSSVRVP